MNFIKFNAKESKLETPRGGCKLWKIPLAILRRNTRFSPAAAEQWWEPVLPVPLPQGLLQCLMSNSYSLPQSIFLGSLERQVKKQTNN